MVETSPENFLLNMESVCSQVVPGSGSSCKWESVGTENENMESVCSQVVPGSGSSCKWELVGREREYEECLFSGCSRIRHFL